MEPRTPEPRYALRASTHKGQLEVELRRFDGDLKSVELSSLYKNAILAVKELRAEFPYEYAQLGGKTRVDPFLRGVLAQNDPDHIHELSAGTTTLDLSGKAPVSIQTSPDMEVAYDDFSF